MNRSPVPLLHLGLLLGSAMLIACGQTGPLYMPEDAPPTRAVGAGSSGAQNDTRKDEDEKDDPDEPSSMGGAVP